MQLRIVHRRIVEETITIEVDSIAEAVKYSKRHPDDNTHSPAKVLEAGGDEFEETRIYDKQGNQVAGD